MDQSSTLFCRCETRARGSSRSRDELRTPLAMLNLINDPWIPVRCRAGRRVIRPDQIAEPDVLRPDWPRPDLNLACLELLVGLVYLAHPPRGSDDRKNPPDAATLRQALRPLAPAFELLGDGPRFLQTWEPLEGKKWPCDQLFIDKAGNSTVKKNEDLMTRRSRYRALPLPQAAIALYTLQAFAPEGGRGINTSLRGGGPMVTLVRPGREGLWPLVWANVPRGEPLSLQNRHTLPWMRPTRRSKPIGGRRPESLPGKTSRSSPPPEVFFGQPRRLRLVAQGDSVTHFVQRPYGENYPTSLWRHPLTPYYAASAAELRPVRAKPGSFGYRHWRGVILQSDKDRQPTTLWQYLQDVEHGDCSLIVGGWAMKSAKPLDFIWSEQPVFRFLSRDDEYRAADTVEAAEQTALELARGISLALGEGARSKVTGRKVGSVTAGGGLRARERFFVNTQTAFEEVLHRMTAGAGFAAEEWVGVMRQVALAIFDAEVTPGLADLSEARRAAAIGARRQLLAAFSGRSAAGKKIFDALGLEPAPIRRKGGRAA